jgi:Cu(I)/Ag(I) efflux system membrane fusion protein
VNQDDSKVMQRSPRRFVAIAVAVALAVGGAGGGTAVFLATRAGHAGEPHAAQAKPKYTCPMHPSIVSDHPGECPICGMKLVAVAASPGASAAAGEPAAAAKPKYTCPMHPSIVSDHPGECPICGMKLVKADPPGGAAGGEKQGPRKVAFYRSPMDPKQTSPVPRKDEMGMDYLPVYDDEAKGGAPVEGLATVNIDPMRQQLIGLHTAEVTRGLVNASWRTIGRVAVDETRVHHVSVKVSGFVERVFADYVGKAVRAGEPLFTIYSPELLSVQSEYLLALKTRSAMDRGGASASAGGELVAAARERLELWDVSAGEIERLERTGRPTKTLTFFSPMTGVVTKKDVVMGHRISEGDMPYEITSLSQLWVLADAYESDLSRIKLGMTASLTLQAVPDRTFKGKVIFVDPLLDPKTRTAKVRLAFANPTGELKPEMFGEVTLHASPRQGLRIPGDAVIDSGTKKVVFVSLGDGKFQPREVRIGASSGDRLEVLSGLEAGDQVVTRANFLIDSESRLKASLAAMGASRETSGETSGGTSAGDKQP